MAFAEHCTLAYERVCKDFMVSISEITKKTKVSLPDMDHEAEYPSRPCPHFHPSSETTKLQPAMKMYLPPSSSFPNPTPASQAITDDPRNLHSTPPLNPLTTSLTCSPRSTSISNTTTYANAQTRQQNDISLTAFPETLIHPRHLFLFSNPTLHQKNWKKTHQTSPS